MMGAMLTDLEHQIRKFADQYADLTRVEGPIRETFGWRPVAYHARLLRLIDERRVIREYRCSPTGCGVCERRRAGRGESVCVEQLPAERPPGLRLRLHRPRARRAENGETPGFAGVSRWLRPASIR